MDGFSIIQHFFTRMNCTHCQNKFEPEGIQLIRENHGVYVVSVYCNNCERQVGVAMVGLEAQGEADAAAPFQDPELTEAELERLSQFEPIGENDVLAAHEFFQGLDGDWMKFIPPEFRQPCTVSETEDPPA
ncbi:MAG: hypothetical protein SFZ03_01030 [Candidatus Melainabacteria bacterium]|nr:hypothetical protein [Candidatus Melainabacteria bacterium]